MRIWQSYLLLRFLLWPPAILIIISLFALGAIVQRLGYDDNEDVICVGQQGYDLNDSEERHRLRMEFVYGRISSLSALSMPPCDFLGARVSRARINKLFEDDGARGN